MTPAPTTPRTGRRRHDREIIALAVPAFGALVAEPLFVMVDSAIVGHLGRAARVWDSRPVPSPSGRTTPRTPRSRSAASSSVRCSSPGRRTGTGTGRW
ncbi:hypothetical protein ABZ086_34495, partial [Streptomyces halstedii]